MPTWHHKIKERQHTCYIWVNRHACVDDYSVTLTFKVVHKKSHHQQETERLIPSDAKILVKICFAKTSLQPGYFPYSSKWLRRRE